jgi:hypothetical protein
MESHPKKIGKYDVECVIGQGGMGVVYKAVDSQIGRYVAIKMITGGGDPTRFERFRSEARSTGSLQCPNIVTVYDFGEQDGNPYLVMQYLEGASLDSIIQKGTFLTLSERLGIIIDVCNGLAYAHQRGVIHRDIKPANIMVLQDGVNDGMAVIVDFGIARIGGDTRLTKADQIVGSVHYMSSEQLQAKELDNRTDIYATGVVLFQILTGALPFDSPDTASTLLKIINEPPPPLSAYLKDCPAELEKIVSRALAKKREERYGSANDLAFELTQVREHVKSDTALQLLQRAEVSVGREEWTRAREQLQQVLRIDRENAQAQKLMSTVEERLRQRQQIEQARELRRQADEAQMDQRYDDALQLLDQAVLLDANNTDLQAFRKSVRAAKVRASGLQQALRRTETALQDGDLDEAQNAVMEAFKINAQDTQAKALYVVITQRVEERAHQEYFRKLLEKARDQIAARDLDGAFATLKNAEQLDPTSNELQAVAKMAVSARQQENRRTEIEEFRRQVEAALVREDYSTAVAKAEEGLRKFPLEQSLLKLNALADAQRVRIEQKKFVRQQVAAANLLFDAGQLQQALAVLDRASQKAPGNTDLETLRSIVQDRLTAEESDKQKLNAIESVLVEGKRIFQERGAKSAIKFLDSQDPEYLEFPQVRALHDGFRSGEGLQALDEHLARENNPAKRVQLAEDAFRANPENQLIGQRLAELQKVRSAIRSAIERARGFEAAGRVSDALREWQQLKTAYSKVVEFESQVKRLESLQRETKTEKIAEATIPAAPPATKAAESGEALSATRLMSTPVSRKVDVKSTSPAGKAVAAPVVPLTRKVSPPPETGPAQPSKISLQLKNLFAGPQKYILIAVAAIVLVAIIYLLSGAGREKEPAKGKVTPKSLQVHIVANPPDAVVTSGSNPVPNAMVSIVPGTSVVVDVARLGYTTKQVQVRQESDGKIVLEPEALHLSIQTSQKSGTVQLDGQTIGNLSSGNMDEYDLVPDGNNHKLRVTTLGKQLFTVEFEALAGSAPQVKAFDADDLFLIASLGSTAKLYAGNLVKNVRFGDQNVALTPAGSDLSLSEQSHEVRIGEGSEQGSLSVEIANAPSLAVHSIDIEGQVQVISNVENATLTVDGTAVKRQRRGWRVSRPPGTYNFSLSAEGYEPQKWAMTLERRQALIKNVDLKPKVKPVTLASLVISGGIPGTVVDVDGKRAGELDTNGSLNLPNALANGQHSIALAKPYYESRIFEISAKPPEVRVPDASLVPWPTLAFRTTAANITVKCQRAGDPQVRQANASTKLRLPPGKYKLQIEAPGYQESSQEVELTPGDETVISLKLVPVPDYQFQDAAQVIHEGPWVRAKDAHRFVYLKPGLLLENLVFTKPGKNLFWNKKIEWVIEASEGSARVQYSLDGQKLNRKLVVGEDVSDQKEAKVDAVAAGEATSLSVHIRVDGSHVEISNDKGVVLDDYTAAQHDFSGGRLGIRTDSRFVARSK